MKHEIKLKLLWLSLWSATQGLNCYIFTTDFISIVLSIYVVRLQISKLQFKNETLHRHNSSTVSVISGGVKFWFSNSIKFN